MIPKEPPIAGTVIRYAFLWSSEEREGLEAGRKDRPAVLVIARNPGDGRCVVVPITHREPEGRSVGMEIPEAIRRTLGLDERRQWIIVSEGNAFAWPGPDLRAIPDLDPPTVIYGTLPKRVFALVLAHMQTLIRARRLAMSPRR